MIDQTYDVQSLTWGSLTEKTPGDGLQGHATTRGSRSQASGTIRDFVGPGGGCTPSRRGVFLARRTPRAEGMTGARTRRKSATGSRRLRTRFASRVAAPFHQRGDRPRLRGPSVPAARIPCPAAPSRASPRKLSERSRCAILTMSSTRCSFSSLSYLSPPPIPLTFLSLPIALLFF